MTPMQIMHKIGNDPRWQFHIHGVFTTLWVASMLVAPFLPAFRGGHNLSALLIMEVSLWANAATHFGAMSAAIAGMLQTPKEIPTSSEEVG